MEKKFEDCMEELSSFSNEEGRDTVGRNACPI